ncbi:Imm63 family immunity protein [Paenibacillus sp. R14(2021)]|uniref:Imm63 family immunity protein n=1 Tax=Paenibacillus sp. R14(2021) TaxID=2859228 RepID=UPI001C6166D3|nr:Imm63 family immunity protein [Paenibacillus sp. R14(2021)]
MQHLTLELIKNEVNELAKKIQAPSSLLPTFGGTEDGARPHIEVGNRGFHYVVVERGNEIERKTTSNKDQLIYWIFNSVTFSMACEYELRNRIPNQDFRRLLFKRQIELMRDVKPDFAKELEMEKQRILINHPYRDEV